jgi:hypothetical protein
VHANAAVGDDNSATMTDSLSAGVVTEESSLATSLKPVRRRRRRTGPVPVDNKHVEQLLFGDATPFYLASRLSCQRIAKMFPASATRPREGAGARAAGLVGDSFDPAFVGADGASPREVSMKFVVLLRDPVERLYSEFHMKHRYCTILYCTIQPSGR